MAQPVNNGSCRLGEVILLDGRSVQVLIQPRLFAGDLFDMVASHFGLKEKEYFGLAFLDETWLNLERRVLEHEYAQKCRSKVKNFSSASNQTAVDVNGSEAGDCDDRMSLMSSSSNGHQLVSSGRTQPNRSSTRNASLPPPLPPYHRSTDTKLVPKVSNKVRNLKKKNGANKHKTSSSLVSLNSMHNKWKRKVFPNDPLVGVLESAPNLSRVSSLSYGSELNVLGVQRRSMDNGNDNDDDDDDPLYDVIREVDTANTAAEDKMDGRFELDNTSSVSVNVKHLSDGDSRFDSDNVSTSNTTDTSTFCDPTLSQPYSQPQSQHDDNRLVLYFLVKYFVESITVLQDTTTVELFYLQAKSLFINEIVQVDLDTGLLLSALVLHSTYGDCSVNESKVRSRIQRLKLVSNCLLNHLSTVKVCEDRILEEYRKLSGITKGEAIFRFMQLIEKQPTYGVHFYEVKDKSGTPYWLGLSFKGIDQFDYHDRRFPRRQFAWKQLENLYFREKKFSIEVRDLKRVVHTLSSINLYENAIEDVDTFDDLSSAICDPTTQVSVSRRTFGPCNVTVYVWFAASSSLTKCIWSMAISQHQFYIDRRLNKCINSLQRNQEELIKSLDDSLCRSSCKVFEAGRHHNQRLQSSNRPLSISSTNSSTYSSTNSLTRYADGHILDRMSTGSLSSSSSTTSLNHLSDTDCGSSMTTTSSNRHYPSGSVSAVSLFSMSSFKMNRKNQLNRRLRHLQAQLHAKYDELKKMDQVEQQILFKLNQNNINVSSQQSPMVQHKSGSKLLGQPLPPVPVNTFAPPTPLQPPSSLPPNTQSSSSSTVSSSSSSHSPQLSSVMPGSGECSAPNEKSHQLAAASLSTNNFPPHPVMTSSNSLKNFVVTGRSSAASGSLPYDTSSLHLASLARHASTASTCSNHHSGSSSSSQGTLTEHPSASTSTGAPIHHRSKSVGVSSKFSLDRKGNHRSSTLNSRHINTKPVDQYNRSSISSCSSTRSGDLSTSRDPSTMTPNIMTSKKSTTSLVQPKSSLFSSPYVNKYDTSVQSLGIDDGTNLYSVPNRRTSMALNSLDDSFLRPPSTAKTNSVTNLDLMRSNGGGVGNNHRLMYSYSTSAVTSNTNSLTLSTMSYKYESNVVPSEANSVPISTSAHDLPSRLHDPDNLESSVDEVDSGPQTSLPTHPPSSSSYSVRRPLMYSNIPSGDSRLFCNRRNTIEEDTLAHYKSLLIRSNSFGNSQNSSRRGSEQSLKKTDYTGSDTSTADLSTGKCQISYNSNSNYANIEPRKPPPYSTTHLDKSSISGSQTNGSLLAIYQNARSILSHLNSQNSSFSPTSNSAFSFMTSSAGNGSCASINSSVGSGTNNTSIVSHHKPAKTWYETDLDCPSTTSNAKVHSTGPEVHHIRDLSRLSSNVGPQVGATVHFGEHYAQNLPPPPPPSQHYHQPSVSDGNYVNNNNVRMHPVHYQTDSSDSALANFPNEKSLGNYVERESSVDDDNDFDVHHQSASHQYYNDEVDRSIEMKCISQEQCLPPPPPPLEQTYGDYFHPKPLNSSFRAHNSYRNATPPPPPPPVTHNSHPNPVSHVVPQSISVARSSMVSPTPSNYSSTSSTASSFLFNPHLHYPAHQQTRPQNYSSYYSNINVNSGGNERANSTNTSTTISGQPSPPIAGGVQAVPTPLVTVAFVPSTFAQDSISVQSGSDGCNNSLSGGSNGGTTSTVASSNTVPIASCKGNIVEVDVVTVGHFQPGYEETKPYTLSDFYKYSQRYRNAAKNQSNQSETGATGSSSTTGDNGNTRNSATLNNNETRLATSMGQLSLEQSSCSTPASSTPANQSNGQYGTTVLNNQTMTTIKPHSYNFPRSSTRSNVRSVFETVDSSNISPLTTATATTTTTAANNNGSDDNNNNVPVY